MDEAVCRAAYTQPPMSELWRPYMPDLFPPRSRTHSETSSRKGASNSETSCNSDFQFRPADYVVKEGEDVAGFEELAKLLDGANLIYCWNQHQLYGLLRANPGDVTDLSSYRWAPCADIHNPTLPNPLRPRPADPYFHLMNDGSGIADGSGVAALQPRRGEVEAITRPTIDLPPDHHWTPTKKMEKKEKEEDGVGAFSQESGASEYNADDTKEDIAQYLSSKRWSGSGSKSAEPEGPYFRDSRMIHWQFKTISVCGDINQDEMSIQDIRACNRHVKWWDWPSVHYARNHGNKKGSELDVQMGQQGFYTIQFCKRRFDVIHETLEREVRFVADVLTMLHHHQLPLTVHCKRWNRSRKQYQWRWELVAVRFSTPAMLTVSSSVTYDPNKPNEPLPSRKKPGKKTAKPKKPSNKPRNPRQGTKAAALPKPQPPAQPPLAQPTNQPPSVGEPVKSAETTKPQPPSVAARPGVSGASVPRTYNVVCALALSNYRHGGNEGEWCEFMRMSSQKVAAVACLVIDHQHPNGTVRFFAPSPQSSDKK
jgi:hypothetical protein